MINRKQQHEKLFNQFVYEMFCEPVKGYKSKSDLCKKSTRTKFLERMRKQAKDDPGEI